MRGDESGHQIRRASVSRNAHANAPDVKYEVDFPNNGMISPDRRDEPAAGQPP